MTRSEVTSLSLKLLALYLWVHALIFASNLGFFVRQVNEPGQTAVFALAGLIVPVLLLAALGALLFYLSPILASRMTGGSAPARFEDRGEVGTIGLRLAAVLLWLRAIQMTSRAMFQIRIARIDGRWGEFLTEVATIVVLAAVGAWLLFRAGAIAQRWFGRRAAATDPGSAATLQAVAFSVVGLWILADALPNLAGLFASTLESARSGEFGDPPSLTIREEWTHWLEQVLRAVLGLVLFLSGNGLSALWHWIRRAGLAAQRAGLEPKSDGR
jgi:hypothetical protein